MIIRKYSSTSTAATISITYIAVILLMLSSYLTVIGFFLSCLKTFVPDSILIIYVKIFKQTFLFIRSGIPVPYLCHGDKSKHREHKSIGEQRPVGNIFQKEP